MIKGRPVLYTYYEPYIAPEFALSYIDVLTDIVVSSKEQCFLKFDTLAPAGIMLGKGQSIKCLNTEKIREDKIRVTRRQTGGTAIWANPFDISYTICVPQKYIDTKDRKQSDIFLYFTSIFGKAINRLGIKANQSNWSTHSERKCQFCFCSLDKGELTVNGKKLCGGAFKANSRIYMQQGYTLINTNQADLMKYFNYTGKDIACENLNNLLKQSVKIKMFVDCVIEEFSKIFDVTIKHRTTEETHLSMLNIDRFIVQV